MENVVDRCGSLLWVVSSFVRSLGKMPLKHLRVSDRIKVRVGLRFLGSESLLLCMFSKLPVRAGKGDLMHEQSIPDGHIAIVYRENQ